MATAKKSNGSESKAKKSTAKSKGSGRCWEGYEPTPGKKPGTKGSCKPKD